MNNTDVKVVVKQFKLPGREEDFLMVDEFVYRADNKEQAFARDDDGKWIIIRKAFVNDPAWLAILEATYNKKQ